MNRELDPLGELLMLKLRDVSLELCEGLLEGRFESPGHRAMQRDLGTLPPEARQLLLQFVTYCVDGGLNDFLASVDRESRRMGAVQISVDGMLATDRTDSLHKELHGEDGWKKRFSKYK